MDKKEFERSRKIGGIVFCVLLVGITFSVGLLGLNGFKDNYNYLQCCNNTACSDTYYTPKDNLCHLSLCENRPYFFSDEDCTYPGANISMNATELIG